MSSRSRLRLSLTADSSNAGSETDEQLLPSRRPSFPISRSRASYTQDTDSQQPQPPQSEQPHNLPTLSHRLRHDASILALALSDNAVFAGTQRGEILVYSLDTYDRIALLEAHKSSVLDLCICKDENLLFSTAADRITNVWDLNTYQHVYSLYSRYDTGDVFCVAYSSLLRTVYLGAQNTSIQWYDLKEKDHRPKPKLNDHPSLREDPFFDSRGPGGVRTPRPADQGQPARHAAGGDVLEIDRDNIKHFAHYGYVYCMMLAKGVVPDAPGDQVLISAGGDGAINLWTMDADRGGAIELLFTLDDGREEGQSILSIALDATFLYSGRTGGEVNVWDLETRQLVRSLKAHRDDVLSICIGGGYMFSAAVTGYVRKYDRQYQCASRLHAHDGQILTSAFTYHKGKPLYVTGANDNTVAVWDVSDCIMSPTAVKRTTDEQMLDHLKRFISYRTVSSDPKYKGDCRRGASYLRSVFKGFGAATEMLPTEDGSNPVILARFRGNPSTAATRKKVLFYGHYDVVAADNEQGKWITDPFVMEGIDGYLYGRGTSDNKGPIMAAIFACAELMSEQALGSDVIFLIEGEEESGSRGFANAVKQHKHIIGDVDWILLANSYWLDDSMPCVTYGLRGVIHATVQVESEHPDLHSGVDGSSQLDEPLKDLVMLLSTLTGTHGKVKIPSFYDPIPELSKEEELLYEDITQALVARNPDLGDPRDLALSLMRRWREASLTVHRFQTSGPANATIIPRLAQAALSLRLVPNQEADTVGEALTKYLQSEFNKLGSHNRMTVTIDHQAEPWLGDFNNQIFQTLEKAIMDVWGPIPEVPQHRRKSSLAVSKENALKVTIPKKEEVQNSHTSKPSPTTSSVLANGGPNTSALSDITNDALSLPLPLLSSTQKKPRTKPLYIREGGSIPAIRFLEKEFGAPAAHFPCGQASDSAHLDNERLRLTNLYKSKDIFKKVFRELPMK
ncbi:glutathione degradosome [Aureobasidium sp. EXF-3400]|nr:glutathione degradosome [Aureobasidium sp. EXF-12344]KAI4784977.1 glutathione degradosome [Aureobasidium sp. EXF-3400]